MFRPGLNADQIHHVNDDKEEQEHAANHHKAPRHLMRALVFFPDGSELTMRINPQAPYADHQSDADQPVKHADGSSSLASCGVLAQ